MNIQNELDKVISYLMVIEQEDPNRELCKRIDSLIEISQAINFTDSSLQLKEKEKLTFEDWIDFNGYRKEYTDLVDNGFAYDIGVLYRKYTQAIKQPLIV